MGYERFDKVWSVIRAMLPNKVWPVLFSTASSGYSGRARLGAISGTSTAPLGLRPSGRAQARVRREAPHVGLAGGPLAPNRSP